LVKYSLRYKLTKFTHFNIKYKISRKLFIFWKLYLNNFTFTQYKFDPRLIPQPTHTHTHTQTRAHINADTYKHVRACVLLHLIYCCEFKDMNNLLNNSHNMYVIYFTSTFTFTDNIDFFFFIFIFGISENKIRINFMYFSIRFNSISTIKKWYSSYSIRFIHFSPFLFTKCV